MKLTKIIVSGFRSIKGSEELILDPKINILIGANDHGKSNLLEAIRCLNDDRPITEDDKNWDLPDTSAVKVQWHFSLTEEELSKLPTDTEGAAEESQFFPTNEDKELIFYREGVGSAVKILSTPVNMQSAKEPELLSLRPRIELFEPPKTNLVDKVNRAQIETDEFEFMQGIFRLAGLWEHIDEIFTKNDITTRLLTEASEKLTKVLQDQWNQGKDLKWMLTHAGTEGDHIEIMINDPSIKGRYTRPSLKSSGFQTYFLISMVIYARTQKNKHTASTYFYLFDEPGTFLHPYAQLDLQRSFEVISDDAQLVYTTHSLFLISKNYPNRNKVVSKSKDGTKVDQKPFLKNWKSVRESLGILLSNNFLIAEKTLLVEGPSDVIYILDVIKRMKTEEKIDIDLNDLSVVDAGSADNYVAMAKLMLSEGREIVALLDGDKSGELMTKRLEKTCSKEVTDKNLKIYSLPKGKSIEDICVDIDVLRDSVKSTAKYMIDNQIRVYKEGIDAQAEIEKINPSDSDTLGKVIDDITKTLFDPEEKISKLSIALDYEDRIADRTVSPGKPAEDIIKELKRLLNLRGERSFDKGVFEEVS
jgi:predicted ATP-dependent endonuclease of OLD family